MVLAIVDDLLFSSKIRAAAGACGRTLVVARGRDSAIAAATHARPGLVIVDLDRAGADPGDLIRELKALEWFKGVPFVAYGSHVHADRFESARAAGCDKVLARSGFVIALPQLLRQAPVAEAGSGPVSPASGTDRGEPPPANPPES